MQAINLNLLILDKYWKLNKIKSYMYSIFIG